MNFTLIDDTLFDVCLKKRIEKPVLLSLSDGVFLVEKFLDHLLVFPVLDTVAELHELLVLKTVSTFKVVIVALSLKEYVLVNEVLVN